MCIRDSTKTLQEGQNGLRRVTMQNVYDTNGVLLEQTILSTETIREPVNKKEMCIRDRPVPARREGHAADLGSVGQAAALELLGKKAPVEVAQPFVQAIIFSMACELRELRFIFSVVL